MRMPAQVECHSGYRAAERPLRFSLAGREYRVEKVLDRWYGPDEAGWRVRADDGRLYVLRHGEPDGEWTAEPV